ncbi:efflux RND transporter periplasmic adaptor subunit [Pyxidicoccus fallax]|uniref:Efflux RND transporter periplasmic adaptor subunit n=1 Tax=Pyxidicoccus fallax TaxID=394095 RepID=A0A848LP62_9BACT|nr:efflux RND transporter periplasmic adaptor subunit [Pyxidicoccus fallax]NMO19667.1 efflux RND transporter periplasmic adaptor subunit [Pyxidicoccus fallax]NPC83926.1 efflux RND transporter periplasmic adaptor subunit [Pyxidicoccus fallax]
MRVVRTWGAGLVTLALAAGCKGSQEEKPQGGQAGAGRAMPVQVQALQPGPVRDTSEYVGRLVSRRSITVYPQVAGYVQEIPTKPGQQVKQGDVLLVVDPRQQRAGLRATQAQRASAEAQLEYARSTRQRSAQLLKEGLLSRQDYDQAVAQAEQAEASARAIQAQIQSQEVQLDFYRVSAPFAGTVGDFPVNVGDYVTPQTALTSVSQGRVLEVSVQVPVERARTIKTGDTPVEVVDPGGKLLVSAPVFFVAPIPSATTQLVEVRAAFENTVGLRPGQLVRVRVVYETREALQVPTFAVTNISSQSFVYVAGQADGGGTVARRVPVKLGQISGNAYEVESGIEPGTQVVVSGLQLLREGQPIQPMPAKPGGPQQGVGGSGAEPPQGQGTQGAPGEPGQPEARGEQPLQPQGQGVPGGPAQPGSRGHPQGPAPGGAATPRQ